MASRCPWKINWSIADVQCRKDDHVLGLRGYKEDGVTQHVVREPDPEHEALLANGITVIHWYAGDRREFTGDWPGPCWKLNYDPGSGARPEQMVAACILPAGHHGRCAP